ncbi:unnamed protein product [Protopolystoma xenopodis]|uniref:Uncharacterized protein n=1 Tax=Protopolystoma xenopodis TaxID=117903 RepID=A0A448XIY1_9PLAT|nr:unnamed protein product [Protopolystoma xenopodis]
MRPAILSTELQFVKRKSEVGPLTNFLPRHLYYQSFLMAHISTFTSYLALSHLLTICHSSRGVPFLANLCGVTTPAVHYAPLFRSATPNLASYLDLPHSTIDPFLIFLVDRLYSLPIQLHVSL